MICILKKNFRMVMALAAVLLLAGFRWSLLFGSLDWQTVNDALEEDYPTVRHLNIDQLQGMLDQQPPPLLVDVRTVVEYRVSHLPGALPVNSFSSEKLEKDRLIVAYCSVGFRSAKFVEQLQQQGFRHAYNLRGSIFMWANQGFPLEAEGRKVTKVHPYSEHWGQLLHVELHSTIPKSDIYRGR